MHRENDDTHLGVVAILDILGTKGVWKTDANGFLNKVSALYDTFNRSVEFLKKEFKKSNQLNIIIEEFSAESLTFSDTIVVSISSKLIQMSEADIRKRLEGQLLLFGILLMSFMQSAIQEKIFFRGSLSLGKIYKRKGILIGPAMDEAPCDYDQSNWIGISLGPQAESLLNLPPQTSFSSVLKDFFIPYDLSKKTGIEKGCYVLNWGRFYFTEKMPEAIHNLKENLEFNIDKYNNPAVYLKYKNTIEYYTKAVKNGRINIIEYLDLKLPS